MRMLRQAAAWTGRNNKAAFILCVTAEPLSLPSFVVPRGKLLHSQERVEKLSVALVSIRIGAAVTVRGRDRRWAPNIFCRRLVAPSMASIVVQA